MKQFVLNHTSIYLFTTPLFFEVRNTHHWIVIVLFTPKSTESFSQRLFLVTIAVLQEDDLHIWFARTKWRCSASTSHSLNDWSTQHKLTNWSSRRDSILTPTHQGMIPICRKIFKSNEETCSLFICVPLEKFINITPVLLHLISKSYRFRVRRMYSSVLLAAFTHRSMVWHWIVCLDRS